MNYIIISTNVFGHINYFGLFKTYDEAYNFGKDNLQNPEVKELKLVSDWFKEKEGLK